MNLNYQELLPADFDDQSRVWVYQSSRLLSMQEALQTEDLLQHFVQHWNAHGSPIKGYANLFFGQFIVFIADETRHGVSGCSTDSSVRLVKDLEQLFKINLFDRLSLAFIIKDKVQLVPMPQLLYALENNFVEPSSIYFNNTVLNLKQLKENWLIPADHSWLNRDSRYSVILNKKTLV